MPINLPTSKFTPVASAVLPLGMLGLRPSFGATHHLRSGAPAPQHLRASLWTNPWRHAARGKGVKALNICGIQMYWVLTQENSNDTYMNPIWYLCDAYIDNSNMKRWFRVNPWFNPLGRDYENSREAIAACRASSRSNSASFANSCARRLLSEWSPANPTHEPNKYRSKPPNLVPEISTIFLKNGISNLLVVAQYEVIWLANRPCYLSPSYAGDTVWWSKLACT